MLANVHAQHAGCGGVVVGCSASQGPATVSPASNIWMGWVGMGWFCLTCYATATQRPTSSALTDTDAKFIDVRVDFIRKNVTDAPPPSGTMRTALALPQPAAKAFLVCSNNFV
jgi:hypothetical protein